MTKLEKIAFDNKMKAQSIRKLLNSNFGEDEIIDCLYEIADYLDTSAYELEDFHVDLEIIIDKLVTLP